LKAIRGHKTEQGEALVIKGGVVVQGDIQHPVAAVEVGGRSDLAPWARARAVATSVSQGLPRHHQTKAEHDRQPSDNASHIQTPLAFEPAARSRTGIPPPCSWESGLSPRCSRVHDASLNRKYRVPKNTTRTPFDAKTC